MEKLLIQQNRPQVRSLDNLDLATSDATVTGAAETPTTTVVQPGADDRVLLLGRKPRPQLCQKVARSAARKRALALLQRPTSSSMEMRAP